MSPVVAVIAPGMMGSGVGGRLAQNGVEVRTSLAGRSEATVARAKAAGMIGVSDDQIAAADIILSIVPPGEALGLAERLAPALRAAGEKPIYVDCNALHPGTVLRIARVIEEAGATFVDGGIIGGPPTPGSKGTRIYLSGEAAPRVAVLQQYGLEMPVQPGPIGAASAMKMSYAGITKGFTALGAAMMLAATRAGTADDLKQELLRQPAGAVRLAHPAGCRGCIRRRIAGWPRWRRSPSSSARTRPRAQFYQAAARLYERIAADFEGERKETAALDAFCKSQGTTP